MSRGLAKVREQLVDIESQESRVIDQLWACTSG
jgi:hypothetical protein